jgi:hypothetical protein
MLTTHFVSTPLIGLGGHAAFQRSAPAPLVSLAQRPRVLARSPHVPQQLSLFGPQGGRLR